MANLNEFLIRSNVGMAYYREGNITRKLMEATKIEVNVTVEVHDYLPLGTLVMKHYPGSVSIKGSMELYYCSTFFVNKIKEYKDHGTPFYFNLQVINGKTDSSSTGRQNITFVNVLMNNVPITLLGTDTNAITGTLEFVADDYIVNGSYNELEREP